MVYEKDKDKICSRAALKNFLEILCEDENVLVSIHNMLLETVIDVWFKYRLKHNNNVPLTDMQYCIIKV